MVYLALFPGLVTVAFPPTPLPKALEALSIATGQRLECAPPLQDEVLIARLKDADGPRVLREVAKCLDARWEAKDDGLVLRPDPVAAMKRATAARRAREADVAASLKDIAARLAAQPALFGPAQAATYRKAVEENRRAGDGDEGPVEGDGVYTDLKPSWRAFARVVAILGARTFLALRPGERIVWSDRSTPMQLPLGLGAERALATFRREQALIAPRAVAARFRLIAANDAYGRGVSLQFTVLDPRGGVIADESAELDGSTEGGPEEDAPEKHKEPRERPLAASTEEKEYFALVNSRSTAVRDETFRRWEPRLADPVAFEPTRWFPGMAFLAAAEAQGRNLIGVVPDAPGGRFAKPLDGQAPQAIFDAFSYLWTLRDGWIVVRATEDPSRVPRAAAGAFIKRSLEKGGIEIDPAAEWVGRYSEDWIGISWLGEHLGVLLSYAGTASSTVTLLRDGLPLWASFSPAVRATLRKGATIPLASLPASAQEAVRRKVYWGDAFEDDEREVTEALPNGIGEGTVSMSVAEEPAYMVWNAAQGEPVSRRPYTASTYGVKLAQDERRGTLGGYDRFRPGLTRRYTLRFEFPARNMEFEALMSETFFDPKAAVVRSLPEAFLREAEVSRRNLLSRPANAPPVNNVP